MKRKIHFIANSLIRISKQKINLMAATMLSPNITEALEYREQQLSGCSRADLTVDLQQTKKLSEIFLAFGETETEDGCRQKAQVVDKLRRIWREWTIERAVQRRTMCREIAEQAAGKLYVFGSYGLGVNLKNSDIDALVVAPCHISRSDFYTLFVEKLKLHSEVRELRLHKIIDARHKTKCTVGLKLKFDHVEVDLLFSALSLAKIPDNLDFKDDTVFQYMDDSSARSFTCYRATLDFYELAPNLDTFKLVLSVIKLWAKRQGIYSANVGYLDGISWTILVTKVCQLYPHSDAAAIIHYFFATFATWPWPKPVRIKKYTNPYVRLPEWDPKLNENDRAHLMPVLKSVFPHWNCSASVSKSNLRILTQKFRNGRQLSEKIMKGQIDWTTLFHAPKYFDKFRYFIIIIVSSKSAEIFGEWKDIVEKNLMHLVTGVDRNENVDFIHVDSRTYRVKAEYFTDRTRMNCAWCFGLQFKTEIHDILMEMNECENEITKFASESGLDENIIEVEIKKIKTKDLKLLLSEEDMKADQLTLEMAEKSSLSYARRNFKESKDISISKKRSAQLSQTVGIVV